MLNRRLHFWSNPSKRVRKDQKHIPGKIVLALAMLFSGAHLITALPAYCQSSDAAIGGSVIVTKHANKAADCWDQGDFTGARDEFRKCIAYSPKSVEFYEGLMQCCEKTQEWPQVVFALDQIINLDPKKKPFYEYEYGLALYASNRFDEAIPHLKAALATADIPPLPFKPIKVKADESSSGSGSAPAPATTSAGDIPKVSYAAPASAAPAEEARYLHGTSKLKEDEAGVKSESEIDGMVQELTNYTNAIRSESILIAEYEGYEKSGEIRFMSPPIAHYHIDKILKGPPLNRYLPIRYEFHTPLQTNAPPGWKFDEAKMMPQKGSKWILFIEFSVPVRLAFNTYYGSYGRQPANEENLNKLDQLLESHNMRLLQ